MTGWIAAARRLWRSLRIKGLTRGGRELDALALQTLLARELGARWSDERPAARLKKRAGGGV